MRRSLLLFLFLALSGAIGNAADLPSTVPIDRILVVVNEGVITNSALQTRMKQVTKQLEAQHISLPPAAVLRKQVLNRMILDRIQRQYAARIGIKITDADVNAAMLQLAERNRMTPGQFEAALSKDGIDVAQFRRQLRTQLIVRGLVDREIRPKVHVSDLEVQRYLAREQMAGDREYKLRDLLVSINQGSAEDAVQKAAQQAHEIEQKLRTGARFSELAIAYSQGPEALNGGALGWKKASELPPVFLRALVSMKPGDVSPPLQTPDGFHIIKLVDERDKQSHEVVTQTHVRHILVKPNAVMNMAEALQRAGRIRQEIEAGAHFRALAAEYSDDSISASSGGDLGWVNPGQLGAGVENVLGTLKVGELSQPITTGHGIELVQVLGRRKRDISGLVGEFQARQQLEARKAEALYDQWLQQLRDDAYVRFLDPRASS